MVKVTIIKDSQDNITGFYAEGHAQYAPQGSDIICSAVSSILQTAVFGLVDYLGLEPEVTTEDGWLNCRLQPELAQDREVKAILETMVIGLQKTEQSYSEYLKIVEERGTNHD